MGSKLTDARTDVSLCVVRWALGPESKKMQNGELHFCVHLSFQDGGGGLGHGIFTSFNVVLLCWSYKRKRKKKKRKTGELISMHARRAFVSHCHFSSAKEFQFASVWKQFDTSAIIFENHIDDQFHLSIFLHQVALCRDISRQFGRFLVFVGKNCPPNLLTVR